MDWKNDEVLKALIEKGKETGSLTYDEVNAALPEGASDPDRLQDILELLDKNGISVIDADEPRRRRGVAGRSVDEVRRRRRRGAQFEDSDGDGRHIDDPVRMYLTQMGEIPLLNREQEIALAKKIEVTRKRFRRKVLECDYALRQRRRDAQARPHRRPAVRPHHQGLADREPREGQDPPAHAAQPADARTPDGAERRRLPAAPRRAHARRGEGRDSAEQLRLRRRKAVTLVEELSIRTQKVQPLMKKLEQIASGWTSWKSEIEALQGQPHRQGGPGQPRERAARPDAHDARRAGQPAQARRDHEAALHRVRGGQARPVRRQPAARRLDRQEVPQPRPVASST